MLIKTVARISTDVVSEMKEMITADKRDVNDVALNS